MRWSVPFVCVVLFTVACSAGDKANGGTADTSLRTPAAATASLMISLTLVVPSGRLMGFP